MAERASEGLEILEEAFEVIEQVDDFFQLSEVNRSRGSFCWHKARKGLR